MKSNTQRPTVAQLTSDEQRNALETQMKSIADAPQTALVNTEDLRIEAIKKNNGQGDRIAVRAASGRFTKATTAVAAADAKAAQQFLITKVKNEVGEELSRKAHLREALYSGAISAAKSDKGIGGAVKAFEALNVDAGLVAAKESMIQAANQEELHPVRVVIMIAPQIMHPEVIDGDKKPAEKKAPSFAEAEMIYTNPQR